MIHKYKLNGLNIVLDVHSGGVHLVDELTYDMLDNVSPPFEKECPERVMEKLSLFYKPEDIASCYSEVVELYNDGVLFSEDDYEKFAAYSVAAPVKAMCLLVEQDCNSAANTALRKQGITVWASVCTWILKRAKRLWTSSLKIQGTEKTLSLTFSAASPL